MYVSMCMCMRKYIYICIINMHTSTHTYLCHVLKCMPTKSAFQREKTKKKKKNWFFLLVTVVVVVVILLCIFFLLCVCVCLCVYFLCIFSWFPSERDDDSPTDERVCVSLPYAVRVRWRFMCKNVIIFTIFVHETGRPGW